MASVQMTKGLCCFMAALLWIPSSISWNLQPSFSQLAQASPFSLPAFRTAKEIYLFYRGYAEKFDEITARAKSRFDKQEWQEVLADAHERLALYKERIGKAREKIAKSLGREIRNEKVWKEIQAVYAGWADSRYDSDRARGFYDSLTRRIFKDERAVFEKPEKEEKAAAVSLKDQAPDTLCRVYPASQITPELIQKILLSCNFITGYQNIRRDAALASSAIHKYLQEIFASESTTSIEMLQPLFFRNKGCYLVGRIRIHDTFVPLVFALIHAEDKIKVDAVLMDEAEIRSIFGYTRSNFHVTVGRYREMIAFLHTLMPNKDLPGLYSSIGFNIMAKSEIYREFVRHPRKTHEIFELAKGTPGNVMHVLSLPTFKYALKIIKDKYFIPKPITRKGIEYYYAWVHEQDRVGRVLDSIEFRNLKVDRRLFTEELLADLQDKAPSVVAQQDGQVVLKHLYAQRKVTPLDIYFREQTNYRALRNVILDYGSCIKELAAAGLFTWDLRSKNFGVIGPGRVVCYDIDDLWPLDRYEFYTGVPLVTYRSFPFDGGVMEFEDRYENEIDPADFRNELGIPKAFMPLFEQVHGDLFTVEFWKEVQEMRRGGTVLDSFPYPSWRRLEVIEKDLLSRPFPLDPAGQRVLFDLEAEPRMIESAA